MKEHIEAQGSNTNASMFKNTFVFFTPIYILFSDLFLRVFSAFQNSIFNYATISNSTFHTTDFTGANLDNADLSYADMTDIKFNNASMSNTYIWSTHLRNADFTGAELYGIQSGSCGFATFPQVVVNFVGFCRLLLPCVDLSIFRKIPQTCKHMFPPPTPSSPPPPPRKVLQNSV